MGSERRDRKEERKVNSIQLHLQSVLCGGKLYYMPLFFPVFFSTENINLTAIFS